MQQELDELNLGERLLEDGVCGKKTDGARESFLAELARGTFPTLAWLDPLQSSWTRILAATKIARNGRDFPYFVFFGSNMPLFGADLHSHRGNTSYYLINVDPLTNASAWQKRLPSGLDHTEILGNTLEEIAAEKAGILKPHVPVIFADTQQESSRVIEERAGELGCPCKKIGKSAYEILKIQDGTLAFSPSNAYYGDTTWKLQNTAMYQPENAMLAMEAMRMIFGEQGDVSGWREALSQVKWEGRMEEILPDFYVDGAHNVSAVRMFVQSIQRDRREKVVLFSAVREKNYEEMIRILCQEKSVSEYVITLIEDKRAAQTEELKQIFQKYTDKPVVVKEELHQALTYLFSRKAGKAVYCLGSLYLTGMIKAITEEAG